ncbi:elongation factor G [Desulfotalea psychrophila]|uniref:Elongation factor G n=1 Tax=Desulfotalea psychrophila (strain LSv54 / DSM 12343) TaxID=177439 RepID=Q6AKJ8_DESPS|nr:elongation factor G [Desulfotalea psychrophila]CAG37127.1 probable elongation factor G [Desulfotalea psychrophila LSv54]
MQDTSMVRNIVIVGHGNCGKTSLAEALLYTSGKINRLGKVDDGSAVMDYDAEETGRGISINTGFHNYLWNKHHVFLADAPGDDNFLNEALFTTNVSDGALFTIGAILGVKGQTIKFAEMVAAKGLPTVIAINKMDRERANFARTLAEMKESLPLRPVAIQLPIGEEGEFRGFVDIITEQAYLFTGESGKHVLTDLSEELRADLKGRREYLMEVVAETDDDLIEKFLEEGELTVDELVDGLRAAVIAAKLAPVCVCSALHNQGSVAILDILNTYLPSPLQSREIIGVNAESGYPEEIIVGPDESFVGLVFKTMADPYAGRLTIFKVVTGILKGDNFFNANQKLAERFGQLYLLEGKEQRAIEEAGPGMVVAVAKLKSTVTGDTLCCEDHPVIIESVEPFQPVISFAVSAKKGDEEKLFSALTRMLDEDQTLSLSRQPQTEEVLLSGIGRVHLDVVGSRIKRKFGVEMALAIPKIPYMETIRGAARVQGKHKKQSGGRGQYGDCWIEISPLPGEHYEFVDKIVGGVIPQQYRPAVDKGVQEAMERGVLAGYPFIDVKVTLVDGSFHNVDSSELAFKIAGSLAFKKGAEEAGVVLLEPYMNMVINVDKDHVGDIMGDLSSRRGKVMGMDSDGKHEIINAQVPQAEIQSYATELTSMTGGLGSFSLYFSHYEEVPAQIADKIVTLAQGE